jgi:hypothetical protein
MRDLLGLATRLRCGDADPAQVFRHRLRVGLIVAVLILLLSLLR